MPPFLQSQPMPAASPKILVPALVALLLLPAAHAKYAYGSIVDKNDDDYTPVASIKPCQLCGVDAEGDGLVSRPEPLYLVKAATCAPVTGKNIRITPTLGYAAGTQVAGPADADYGLRLAPVEGISRSEERR